MDPDSVLEAWLDRSGEYSPRYYAYYGPNETSERIREHLDATVGRDAAVLELGCSSGRHLSHLHEHGYSNLHGIEINDGALNVMEDVYPDLADAGTFYFDAIENVITGFDDGQFDAVFSVETLQHVHADNAWVFEEVARITARVLITVEIEGDEDRNPSADPVVKYIHNEFPLYKRNWKRRFTRFGFEETHFEAGRRGTLRVFQLIDS